MSASPEPTTVLLAEDDADIRESLGDLLEEAGYPVVFAANGLEGLDQAKTLPRNALVVLDLNMPVLSGYDMLEQMRADPVMRELPVLLITASPDPRRTGGERVLRKPFDADAFVAAVERACVEAGFKS